MIYQGFFILLYIKVEGNKTALKDMQKITLGAFQRMEKRVLTKMKMGREKR